MVVGSDKSEGGAARNSGAGFGDGGTSLREQGVGDIVAVIARVHTQMYAPNGRYFPPVASRASATGRHRVEHPADRDCGFSMISNIWAESLDGERT